ncbi:beta/gamma crystallin family protein [Caenimonas aquaedulcis]|uniref:Beta/gamma crystallin family protein n=1 Tax=Caenimonas aquaedulcis TaxID=2793270 RepID=A0A931H1T4_9BURK|nr:beta/gamma crystallin family protein [Caenimonas aquaedulcis]MBG9387011.1 beta/gamma crystallin family protein [Caenimonas aquaedulcis]
MNFKLKAVLGAAAVVLGSQAMAQVTFYEHDGYRGRSFTTDQPVRNMSRAGFGDMASSVVVQRGRWEVCDQPRFEGNCMVLRRGSYASLRDMGMNDRVFSVRKVDDRRVYRNEAPEPVAVIPAPAPEFRRRPQERLFEAPISSVHAIVGPPNQRCWVERQAVTQGNQPNVGGAIVGGLLGGIIGHQIGGGSGRDAATGVGAVAGAAIGANTGGGSTVQGYNDVRRCENVASTTPAYYDVAYVFRGVEHHVQMTEAPSRQTVMVNDRGEPRQ